MLKTILKLLVYQLFEKMARLESLIEALETSSGSEGTLLASRVRVELTPIQQQLRDEKTFLNTLFSEKNLKESGLFEKLQELIYTPYQQLCRLSQLVSQFLPGTSPSETRIFLEDVLGNHLAPSAPDHPRNTLVLLQPEGTTTAPYTPDGVETLSVLDKNNPLGWLGLTRQFANHHVNQGPVWQSQLKGLNEEQQSVFKAVAAHALCLRLLGPAYYFFTFTESLLRPNQFTLTVVENALFFGLNHFNFTEKNLVILHEAAEKATAVLLPESVQDNQLVAAEGLFTKSRLSELFRTVEKVIPESVAFSEKQFQRAMALQEALGQGILLSSYRPYSVGEIYDTLTEKQEKAAETGSPLAIYDVLNLVTETPNTPREIINAGWLHQIERAPVWLYNAFTESPVEGGLALRELLDRQDHLLLKSIETSEIHRVLLCGV